MFKDTAIVTMEGEYETAPKLLNGTSLNDLQWPFQDHDYSTSNNLKVVQNTAIKQHHFQWPWTTSTPPVSRLL